VKNNVIKVGTLFSGIGAPEIALKLMKIPQYKINAVIIISPRLLFTKPS
jgi:hypothetical protein